MNAKQKWILGAAAFLLLLIIAGFGYQELKKEAEDQSRKQAQKLEKELSEEEKSDSGEEVSGENTEQENNGESQEEKQYAEAPDFSVWDQDGKETSLKEILEGKPAVINFWTSKCPPCREEMPDFEELYQELKEQVQFIMVDGVGCMGETEESGRAFVEEQGFTFPVYYDKEMDAVINYGIQAFPTTYILNSDGRLVTGGSGMVSKELLLELLDEVLE